MEVLDQYGPAAVTFDSSDPSFTSYYKYYNIIRIIIKPIHTLTHESVEIYPPTPLFKKNH